MVFITAKLTKKRLIALILAAGLLLCLLIALVAALRGGGDSGSNGAYRNIKTSEDRLTFIQSFGWRVNPEPISVEEITIPEEFDGVYERYNALQLEQECDLTKYTGVRAKYYTYEILNYPTSEEGVLIHLLIYKNRVIGGDVASPNLEGFMHGFRMP